MGEESADSKVFVIARQPEVPKTEIYWNQNDCIVIHQEHDHYPDEQSDNYVVFGKEQARKVIHALQQMVGDAK